MNETENKNNNTNNYITITYSFVCNDHNFCNRNVVDGSKIQSEYKAKFIVLLPTSGAYEA